jgi:hypothetical protein
MLKQVQDGIMQIRWQQGLQQRFYQRISLIVENQLALLAALLLETSIRHFLHSSQTGGEFIATFLQLLIESSPLLLCHYFAYQHQGKQAVLLWCCGFLFYPLMIFSLSEEPLPNTEWTLFGMQLWVFLLFASSGYGLSRLLAKRHNTKSMQVISRLLSLNSVMLMLLIGWAVLSAGIFASTDDPLRNQPIKAVINSETLIVNFDYFVSYLWQFLVMGSLMLSIYWLNRYVLIRRVLARSGVFAYVAACLICTIVMTPILASVVLCLPMNIAEFTFLPSQDYNIFSPLNFRYCFVLLAVSTPIILAFERQQQDKALAEIAQRQSQTELQLLQQQVNPHFLFNTLNNLYALTLMGSKDAPTLVMQLANLLRYTVYEGQNHRVNLAQEIQYIQDFLALQTIRSGDKCQLTVRYPEQAECWSIAPLLLIILVENAFKHGVEPSQSACTINLDIQVSAGTLLVKCENSLPETCSKRSPGIGLENLKRRLSLLYAGKYRLTSKQCNDVWLSELSLELEPC